MRLSLVLALAVIVAGLPATATSDASVEQETPLAGDEWVGISLADTDGSGELVLDVRGQRPAAVGFLLLSDHEDAWGPSTFVFDHDGGERVRAQAGPVDVDVDRLDGSSTLLLTATWTWQAFADEATVVAWVAGDVDEASYTVDAGSQARVLDHTQGAGAFLATNADLGAGVDWRNPPTSLRATAADETRAIDDGLVGVFTHGQVSRDAMVAQTPTGTRECPCSFAGASPGEYRFLAAGAGAGDDASLRLTGADVHLPAPAR